MKGLQQYQARLEIEWVITANRMRAMSGSGRESQTDPVNQVVLRQMHTKLARIEEAQLRLVQGQYGRCQQCQRTIDPERLEALPYVELCVECQRQVERRVLRGSQSNMSKRQGGQPWQR